MEYTITLKAEFMPQKQRAQALSFLQESIDRLDKVMIEKLGRVTVEVRCDETEAAALEQAIEDYAVLDKSNKYDIYSSAKLP